MLGIVAGGTCIAASGGGTFGLGFLLMLLLFFACADLFSASTFLAICGFFGFAMICMFLIWG